MVYFWIRRQVRKVMRPIPEAKAQKYTYTLTGLYVFSAWSCLGLTLYHFLYNSSRTSVKAENSGAYYGRMNKAENMHIYRFSGGKLIKEGEYQYAKDVNPEDSDEDDFYGK